MFWEKKDCDEFFLSCGGKDNIKDLSTCFTRLRIQLENYSVFNKEAMMHIPGVKGIFVRESEIQIVIGLKASSLCRELKSIL